MKYVVILPTIGTHLLDNCLGSMSPEVRSNTIVFTNGKNIKTKFTDIKEFVDNDDNVGLGKAWNYGLKHMMDNDLDYAIICSQSNQFTKGMDDFVEYISESMPKYAGCGTISWHLIALSKELVSKVGYMDENFYPIYYEDTDYIVRMMKLGVYDGEGWQQWEIGTTPPEYAESLKLGLKLNLEGCRQYMIKKWGSDSYLEPTYDHPFNNPDLPLDYSEPLTLDQLKEKYGYTQDGNAYKLFL